PDFIDPTLHQLVTGRVSRNLDVRMCGESFVRRTFSKNAAKKGMSVVEGVMGLFDGGDGSAARLAKLLDLPVLLVVDVRSAAESVAAVVKGFETLDPDLRLSGVVLNRVGSERHLQMVVDAVRQHCRVEIVGALPRDEEITLPSRHLGLHMGSEIDLDGERLAACIEKHLDLDHILRLASDRKSFVAVNQNQVPETRHLYQARIGIARDQAFCFYYQDNFDMLKSAGAELVSFSPLHDTMLPAGVTGLYLGGGYPELYAEDLSANESMRNRIKMFSEAGKPVYGECGGFMYLTRSIADLSGKVYPMAGVYPAVSRMQQRLRRLGYRQAEMKKQTFFGDSGMMLHGHEFHYSTMDGMSENVRCVYRLDDGRSEGYLLNRTLAGYVHLHWGKTPLAAENFVRACAFQRTEDRSQKTGDRRHEAEARRQRTEDRGQKKI
ncbi:MAG: cobyrinate a,c-diamide synthase, partial [Desulfobulbaceae bacterium]|nr:cobyrinate a,c-diamide synthase [Desulfobulbaceae bacterium]